MNDCLIMKTPASWHRDMYREAAPTGNGIIGAMVYGGIHQETIAINHCRLWERGKKQELPDIHETLRMTREGIERGDYWNSNWYSANALKEKGYAPKLGNPIPLCDIRLEMKDRRLFQHYRRTVHMDSGEVTVEWREEDTTYQRKLFVSRSRDLIFYEIRTAKREMDLNVWLDMHETYEDDAKNKREAYKDSIKSYSLKNKIGFYMKRDEDSYYGAIGNVITDGGMRNTDDGKLCIDKASYVLLVVRPFIDRKLLEVQKDDELQDKELYSYDMMRKEHRKLHEELYRCAELHIADEAEESKETGKSNEELLADAYEDCVSTELLEKLWKFGRYLMICGTREDGLPFPLYGLWHGRYKMPWPHNMANENAQMIYWHTMSGGLLYTTKALIHYYTERMDSFRECAKKLFGLPGIYLPAGTTPENCLPNQIVPVIMNWIGCAGWISQHFYQYYLYTGDEDTLKKEILPFMAEAAEFYEHYLVKEETGTYKIYPSVSPENTPGNLIPEGNEDMAHPCPSVVNATMDIAIIKELMTNLLEASEHTGLYQEKQSIWKEIIENLPEYGTTSEGDIREWQKEGLTQRYNHRHLSHIYPLFPGSEIMKGRESEELVGGFEKAVDKRILGAQTGWSLAHMACIYARLEKAEKAMECLDILSKSCLLKNFFTVHNDWRGMGLTLGRGSFAPVQLDAIMGCVQAIQEMLILSGKDMIKLLPALPKRMNYGEVKNLRFRSGYVTMKWNEKEKIFYAELVAKRNTKLHVVLPGFLTEVSYQMNGTSGILKSGEQIEIPEGQKLLLLTL